MNRSRKTGKIRRVTAGLLSAALSVTLLAGAPSYAYGSSFAIRESAAKKAAKVLETDVETASEGCTMLGVYGSYYSQAQEALDRLNEIRKEACDAGNVPDPREPSRVLQPGDYVPVQWSADLESIARIRAMEGGLARSLFTSGHNRLNGKEIWSVQYNGVRSYAEDLAYNWETSMVSGMNQWYEEKEDWVNRNAGAVTGHYTSMINPKYTYVGLGDFYTEAAEYPNTLAGAFCSEPGGLDGTMQDAQTDVMQKIEVQNSFIRGYSLKGKDTIKVGEAVNLELRVDVSNGLETLSLWPVEAVEYVSSDDSVAQITDDGVVTGKNSGSAVITAKSGGEERARISVTVKQEERKALEKGDKIQDKASKAVYEVTKAASESGKGGTVAYKAPADKKASSVQIPKTVTLDGVTYKVTSVAANAFKNNQSLKKVTIGANITSIGKNAFYKCGKLKTITVGTTKLTTKTVGANAFKGVYAKATVKVPAKAYSRYKKLLPSRGLGRQAKIVKQ